MKLVVKVDPRRDREGTLTLHDAGGRAVLGPVPVCATADRAIAWRLKNENRDPLRPGGHPPFGSYRFTRQEAVDEAERMARGPVALLFEPQSGEALGAESHGRLVLELHGGAPGSDGALRETGGGLRVTDDVVEELAARLQGGECELELQPVRESWWSRLFRRRRTLSDDSPDERETSWRSRDSSSSESYQGRGGDFGGAGASGSWDSAPAGRAAAQGAAAAAGAAMGVAAAVAAGEAGAEESPGTSDGSPPDSSGGETETSTSY